MSDSFSIPWALASQVPLPMGFSRQEYWPGWPFLSTGDLPNSGIEPMSPALGGKFFTTEPPGHQYRQNTFFFPHWDQMYFFVPANGKKSDASKDMKTKAY